MPTNYVNRVSVTHHAFTVEGHTGAKSCRGIHVWEHTCILYSLSSYMCRAHTGYVAVHERTGRHKYLRIGVIVSLSWYKGQRDGVREYICDEGYVVALTARSYAAFGVPHRSESPVSPKPTVCMRCPCVKAPHDPLEPSKPGVRTFSSDQSHGHRPHVVRAVWRCERFQGPHRETPTPAIILNNNSKQIKLP